MSEFYTLEEIDEIIAENIHNLPLLIPTDSTKRMLLLIECLRVTDLHAINNIDNQENIEKVQTLDLLKMGLNRALGLLLKRTNFEGFPLAESTFETREFTFNFLYHLGTISSLQRVLAMAKSNLLNISKINDEFRFRFLPSALDQFFDSIDKLDWNQIDFKTNDEIREKWSVLDNVNPKNLKNIPGNFAINNKEEFNDLQLSNITEKLIESCDVWDSGHGLMIRYESTNEIDQHYLAIASKMMLRWQQEAGIHPQTEFKNFKGFELIATCLVLVSFITKHIDFVNIAKQKHPDLRMTQSLLDWKVKEDIIEAIQQFTNFEQIKIEKILELFTITEDDKWMNTTTSQINPLLINLGNSQFAIPIRGALYNPLFTVLQIMENRGISLAPVLKFREEIQRQKLYSLFQGARYQLIEGNTTIREDGKTVTDIDAAIYDHSTKELALFQLKWQDSFYNDPRKLSSKAKNLSHELQKWESSTSYWIEKHGIESLRKNLKLKHQVSKIYLFGICNTLSRTNAYGYSISTETKKMAVTNWSKFAKLRMQIGPKDFVFTEIYNSIHKLEKEKFNCTEAPFTFIISGKKFVLENIYNTTS